MYTAARGCNQAAQNVGTDLQAGKCKIRRVIRYFRALHSFLIFWVHASLQRFCLFWSTPRPGFIQLPASMAEATVGFRKILEHERELMLPGLYTAIAELSPHFLLQVHSALSAKVSSR